MVSGYLFFISDFTSLLSSVRVIMTISVCVAKAQFYDTFWADDSKSYEIYNFTIFFYVRVCRILYTERKSMNCTGKANYVGSRSGEKNGKRWMNIFLDDVDNPLQRLQVYVPAEVQGMVDAVPVGSLVSVNLRVYMRQTDTFPVPTCSLVSINEE